MPQPLKERLFHEGNVSRIAHDIHRIHPTFDADDFVRRVLQAFPDLELKQRIAHITDMLEVFLGKDPKSVFPILIAALPPALSNDLQDGDFGDFIYAGFGEYVARHGCTEHDLDMSLDTLEVITQRFSMEFAIRPFFRTFPVETLCRSEKWARSDHYHVRRLASEGSRPRLPWGHNIGLAFGTTDTILELLWDDPTSCVRRSVANHLNDISKTHPEHVIQLLSAWNYQARDTVQFERLRHHAMRTIRKKAQRQDIG